MLYTYQECIRKYGNDYSIKKEILMNNLFQIEKGLYSDKKYNSENEIISYKYPNAIYTGKSAYYYQGLSDAIPQYHYLATRRDATRIKDDRVKQCFIINDVFDKGVEKKIYQGVEIKVYNKERLLVELVRFKAEESLDYYKEIISSYRSKTYELDFVKIEEYASLFKSYKRIMNAIQLEVL